MNYLAQAGLDGALAALVFFLASLGLGAALGRGTSLRDRVEQTAVGLAMWSLAGLALAQGGLFGRGLWAPVIVFAGYGLVALGRSRAALKSLAPRSRFEAFALFALMLLLGASLLAALGPELEPDALSYHLPVAAGIADTGGDAFDAHNYPTGYPLLAEYAFAYLALVGRPEAARVLHWLAMVLAVLATALLGRRTVDRTAGWLAAVILAGIPLLAWTAQTANTDGFAMLFFALAVLRLDDHFRSGARGDLRAAALFAGLCASVKIWNLMLIPLLAAAVLPFWLRVRRRQGRPALFFAFGRAALFCFAAMLVYLPWALRAWAHTGDPLYPLLSAWTADESTAAFFHYVAARVREGYGAGYGLGDVLLLGWNLTFKPELFGHLPLGWLLLPLLTFGLLRLKRYPLLYLLTPLAAVALAVWFVTSQQVRYLAPWLVYAAVLAAMPVLAVARKRPGAAWIVVLVALTGWGPLAAAQWPRAGFTPRIHASLLAGRVSRDDVRAAHAYNDEWSLWRFVNQALPADALLLGDGAQARWWAQRPFIDIGYDPGAYRSVIVAARQNKERLAHPARFIVTTAGRETEYASLPGERLVRWYANGHLVVLARPDTAAASEPPPLTAAEPFRWLEIAGPRDAHGYWWIGRRAQLMLPPGEHRLHIVAPFAVQGVSELWVHTGDGYPTIYVIREQAELTLRVPPGAVVDFVPTRTVDPTRLGFAGDPTPKAFLVKLSSSTAARP